MQTSAFAGGMKPGCYAERSGRLFRICNSDGYVSKGDMPCFAALQDDRARLRFVAVDGSAGRTRYFLIVDDGLSVLDHGDAAANQCDVVDLPGSGGSG